MPGLRHIDESNYAFVDHVDAGEHVDVIEHLKVMRHASSTEHFSNIKLS